MGLSSYGSSSKAVRTLIETCRERFVPLLPFTPGKRSCDLSELRPGTRATGLRFNASSSRESPARLEIQSRALGPDIFQLLLHVPIRRF